MTESELTQLLSEAFPGAQVSVALEGGHVDITVVSAEFEGLRPVRAPAARLCAAVGAHCRWHPARSQYQCANPLNEVACGQSDYPGWESP